MHNGDKNNFNQSDGINPVGLGQNSGSTSKITHLAWIDDDYRQAICL
jgi:hypothetical protein